MGAIESPSSCEKPTTLGLVAPFFLFLAFLLLPDLIKVENPELPWWKRNPEFWIYPLQTVVCLAALAWFWKQYAFEPFRGLTLAVTLGLLGIVVWITPSLLSKPLGIDPYESGVLAWLGFVPRDDGFDPSLLSEHPLAFEFTVLMRFLRLVICVPLIEEIFWRGFVMRIAADPNRPLHEIPFGTHSWPAYFVTTVAFVAVHNHFDFLAAAIYGSLTYYVAIRTKSLAACVVMHAVANLALGIYVMATKSWGFW